MLSSYSRGFEINTNTASLIVQGNLAKATNDMTTYMERLSTGLRVNRASDDPAGMVISTRYATEISSNKVAKENSQTAISMLKTAESDLTSIQKNLQTMQALVTKAQSGTATVAERTAWNSQYQTLVEDIDRIAKGANFSGIKLLDGTNSAANKIVIQVGTKNDANSRIDISSVFVDVTKAAGGLNIASTGVDTVANANASYTNIQTALEKVSGQIGLSGNFQNIMTTHINSLDAKNENLTAAVGIIKDSDTASDTAALTKAQILQQTAASLLQQANSSSSLVLTLISK